MMRYVAVILLLFEVMSAQNAPSQNEGRHLDIPSISRQAIGAVVSVVMLDKGGDPIAQGSGFLISKDGRVVTNYHVIKSGTSAVVKLPNGGFFAVDGVLASDKDRDVAIIKAHGMDFRTLALGDSDRLQVGEGVVAIGNPLSLESTVSNGIVSAIRTVGDGGEKFVQITAPISPGSSGGPLFDMAGNVVGITTSHIRGGENLNFAIPINDIKPMLRATFPKVSALPDEPETEAVTDDRDTGPSLADTLQWMVVSSADGVGYWEDQSSPLGEGAFLSSSFRIAPQDLSCRNFTVVETITYRNVTGSGANRFFLKVDLGDVDPGSIDEDPSGRIVFRITDNRHAISVLRQEAADLDRLNAGKLISSDEPAPRADDNFLVADKNYRDRLAKAFKRAVILCGGKPSRF